MHRWEQFTEGLFRKPRLQVSDFGISLGRPSLAIRKTPSRGSGTTVSVTTASGHEVDRASLNRSRLPAGQRPLIGAAIRDG